MVFDPSWALNNLALIIRTMQALGFIIVLWLIFQIVFILYNRRRKKILEEINMKLDNINRKLNELRKKK